MRVDPDSESSVSTEDSSMVDEEIRLILIGKTGSGKSSSGNTILGSNIFKSSSLGNSQTEVCSFGSVKRDGKSIMVIDTPGLFGTDKSEDDIKNEILKSVYLAAPGPHAVIYVFPVGDRYTIEEQKTIHMFYEYFGKQVGCYFLVLFTRKDFLVRDGIDEETYLINLPHGLDNFVLECCGRTVFFDNFAVEEEKERQVAELLENVDSILQHNGQGYYTSQLLNEAEKEMRQKDEKFLKDNEVNQQREEERIKEKYREQLEVEVDKQKRAELEKEIHDQISSLQKSWEEKARDDSRCQVKKGLFIGALCGSLLGGALIAGLSYGRVAAANAAVQASTAAAAAATAVAERAIERLTSIPQASVSQTGDGSALASIALLALGAVVSAVLRA